MNILWKQYVKYLDISLQIANLQNASYITSSL